MRTAPALLLALFTGFLAIAQSAPAPQPASPRSAATASPSQPQEENSSENWLAASTRCKSALRDNLPDESVKRCKHALDLALQPGGSTANRGFEAVESYQLYGRAFLLAGDSKQALEQENKSIDAAKIYLKETDQEYAVPFFWRAMIEANLRDTDAALADFKVAEDTHRKATVEHPKMKTAYSHYLARILKEHAFFLDRIGRKDEAAKLRAEADAL